MVKVNNKVVSRTAQDYKHCSHRWKRLLQHNNLVHKLPQCKPCSDVVPRHKEVYLCMWIAITHCPHYWRGYKDIADAILPKE
jgi:hypothetical protein